MSTSTHESMLRETPRRGVGAAPGHSAASCATYIGRVGALAVALGIGAAIANSPGIALADSGAGSSNNSRPSASDASGRSATTPAKRSHSVSSADSPKAGSLSSRSSAGSAAKKTIDPTDRPANKLRGKDRDGATADSSAVADSAATETSPGTDPTTAVERKRPGHRTETGAVATKAVTSTAASTEPEPRAPAATVATPPSASTEAAQPTVRVSVPSSSSATVRPVAPATVQASAAPAPIMQIAQVSLVSGLSSSSASTNGPAGPITSPISWTVLGWVRRQLEYRLFYSAPTTDYHPSENVQSYYGVVTGNINPSQADGDKLTLTVTDSPDKGTVIVNQDGSFAYAPNADFAVEGGCDTFTVLIDTQEGNPPHINVLKLHEPGAGTTTEKVVKVWVKPTSPLGTPEQIQAERIAEMIVQSDAVQAARDQVYNAWLGGTQMWLGPIGGVTQGNLDQLNAAVDEYAFAAALQAQIDPNNPHIVQLELPPHTWYGESVEGSRLVFDNADTLYRFIPVSSSSTYVITGHFVEGQRPADTNFSVATSAGGTASELPGRKLVVDEDGNFTITVSSEPAADGEVNHIQLPANAIYILARDTLGDWNNETAMSLSVERVSEPQPDEQPLTVDQIVARAVANMTATIGVQQYFLRVVSSTDPADPFGPTSVLKPANTLSQPSSAGGQTLATQLQSWGYFQLADDQAMVVTVDPGRAGYFVLPVTNDWTVTDNYWDDPTSLNNYQATPNPDGTYTFVISRTDPHVENWVSTGGLTQGLLYLRFQDLDPDSTDNPTVTTEVVYINQLDPETYGYVTDAERAKQIELRREGYFSRFAPYAQEATQL